jgi:hypothetical protein
MRVASERFPYCSVKLVLLTNGIRYELDSNTFLVSDKAFRILPCPKSERLWHTYVSVVCDLRWSVVLVSFSLGFRKTFTSSVRSIKPRKFTTAASTNYTRRDPFWGKMNSQHDATTKIFSIANSTQIPPMILSLPQAHPSRSSMDFIQLDTFPPKSKNRADNCHTKVQPGKPQMRSRANKPVKATH